MGTIPSTLVYVTGQIVTAAQLNGNPGGTWGNFVLDPPDCQVRQTVAQSIPNNAFTPLLFDSEDFDDDLWHSAGTNTDRITPQTPGIIRLSGGYVPAGSSTGRRITRWALNGSAISGSQAVVVAAAAVGLAIPARTVKVAVNGTTDYIQLQAFQDSGAALGTLVAAEAQSSVTAEWARSG